MNSGAWYAQCSDYRGIIDGKPTAKTIYMSKLIMNAPEGNEWLVDHINHDTLDNRKCNLRLISVSNNSRYRGKINKNNKSGYRNVCQIDDMWCVQLQINGKNTCLGKFDDVDEAGAFAKLMREKYYGKFEGVG